MKLIRRRIFSFAAAAFFAAALSGIVRAQYQIKFWTTDDGLPQNTVRRIVQTADGYLWMTTLDGLVRFDGARFAVFNRSNSRGFGTNRLNQLIQSPDGDLWIGAESDFVIRYHAGEFSTFALDKKGTDKEANNYIINLVADDLGLPVVFTRSGGIFRWNGTNFAPARKIAGETGESYVRWSKTGAFWYSNANVLHRLKNGVTTDFQIPENSNDPYIVRLFEDRRGRMWIGTRKAGLFVVEDEKLRGYTTDEGLPDNDAKPAAEDRDGNIWVVTPHGAVIIAPDNSIKTVTAAQGLSEDFTVTAFQDREGSVWIGTLHRGLNLLTRQTIQFYSIKDGLAAEIVNPIDQLANGDILLGGGGKTLFRDDRFSAISATGENIPQSATAITQDHSGRVWFGNWNGAYYYETENSPIFPGVSGKLRRRPSLPFTKPRTARFGSLQISDCSFTKTMP